MERKAEQMGQELSPATGTILDQRAAAIRGKWRCSALGRRIKGADFICSPHQKGNGCCEMAFRAGAI